MAQEEPPTDPFAATVLHPAAGLSPTVPAGPHAGSDATLVQARIRQVGMGFEQAGDLIGRYRLVEPLGEGGFGTVWLAEQEEGVTRRAALKIIKLGMDTREVIARFEQERQALAMMDHENIARVLDAGATDTGRPFFVMELVKGVPLTRHCDLEQLGLRERLELFATVCSAVNHAHQKGIIHRDIKPSNVLVSSEGGRPLVKVIDFGIAKATLGKLTDRTLMTSEEQVIGTPAYMSPEQAAQTGLDVDTRSDIYSLGVMLYELLVGRPPFDPKTLVSAGYHEMCRLIVEVEPPRPSTRLSTLRGEEAAAWQETWKEEPSRLARDLRGDLDWIVMKALEKDRARRYETAHDFAMDLRRFLAHEPVLASPPSAAYRFRKFARRNRAALAIATVFAFVLIAATAVSLWQMRVAVAARKEALVREAAERQAREEAEAVTAFVRGVFQRTDPSRNGRTITVAETLDHAVKELGSDSKVPPIRRAALQWTVGAAYKDLGLYRESIPLLEQVRGHWLGAAGSEDPRSMQVELDLAESLQGVGQTQEALRLAREVLAIRRRTLGPEHSDTLSAMTALSAYCNAANRHEESVQLNAEAHEASLRRFGPENHLTLRLSSNLAASLAAAGRHGEAVKLMEVEASNLRRTHGAKHPKLLTALRNLAACYAETQRLPESIKLNEEALPLSREIHGPESLKALSLAGNLAMSYGIIGRSQDAERLFKETLALLKKAHGAAHPETLRVGMEHSRLLWNLNRYPEALSRLEELHPACLKTLGEKDPTTLEVMRMLGWALSQAGRLQEALDMQIGALKLMREVVGPEQSNTLALAGNLALSLAAANRNVEALVLMEQTIATARRVLKEDDPDWSGYLQGMALLYRRVGRTEEAARLDAEFQRRFPR